MDFATGALGSLLLKLGRLLKDEYDMHKGVKKDIEFLSAELESMRTALRDVGEVPPEQLSELVKIWARDVRELSYDMEDIVDTFMVRVQQGPAAAEESSPSKNSAKRFVKKMAKKLQSATKRHEVGEEIKDIKQRVEEVAERRDRYKVDAIAPAAKPSVDPSITALYAKATDLVGIDERTEELITRLTKGDDDMSTQNQRRIVSIVGLGGLGKTTLAKAAYDKLKEQFDCAAFVPVGRNPYLKKVFKDILIGLDKQRYKDFNLEILDERQLIDELRDFLQDKRYFIVIDDIWETRYWETIKLALVENMSGSRIITTTRKYEVALETGQVYKLQPLSHDNSRKLFHARIFGGDSKFSDHQEDEVSDKILRRCDGIPLAIITMASLLVGKPREEWSEVHCSICFGNNKENPQVENTMKILSFSYYDLPPHLRTCLLYLSVFPEDYFIEKNPLIWMWIAEGFVNEKQGRSLFEVGEGYFNELLNRSMIQLVEEWEVVELYGYMVHDMVLYLIRSLSFEENFVTVFDNNNEGASSQGRVRRLALHQNSRTLEPHTDMKQVRSLISCGSCNIEKGVPLSRFKHIRVLTVDASQCMEGCHLDYLKNLLHLRHLRLRGGNVELLEIGALKFLQTLDIDNAVKSVGHLTKLLCLKVRYCRVLPDGIGKLTSLEELQIDYRGPEDPWMRFMKELGSLKELRVLGLGLPFASRENNSLAHQTDVAVSLRKLTKMVHLSLTVSPLLGSVDAATWEAAGFALPRHLERLRLYWLRFSRLPSFFINPSRLPCLSHLYIFVKDVDERELRILGGLPELRFLRLDVESSTELVVCNAAASATDDPNSDGLLFQKLMFYSKDSREVRFLLPSKEEDCSSVSFRMSSVHASMLLGSDSERKDVSGGKGIAPTLMPSAQELRFTVAAREFKDGSLGLEYFASLQNVTVHVYCTGASAAEVEEVEVALRRAADVHPNHPALEVRRYRSLIEDMTPLEHG